MRCHVYEFCLYYSQFFLLGSEWYCASAYFSEHMKQEERHKTVWTRKLTQKYTLWSYANMIPVPRPRQKLAGTAHVLPKDCLPVSTFCGNSCCLTRIRQGISFRVLSLTRCIIMAIVFRFLFKVRQIAATFWSNSVVLSSLIVSSGSLQIQCIISKKRNRENPNNWRRKRIERQHSYLP